MPQIDFNALIVPPYIPSFQPPDTVSSTTTSRTDESERDGPFFSDAEMGLTPPIKDPAQPEDPNLGVPSAYQFDCIIYEYMSNLSPRKREKALLNNTMYRAVLHALRHPEDTKHRTAQFRHWARKMFKSTDYLDDSVLTHCGKPVAVREQMYDVLVHCHSQAGHGGRDKTSLHVNRRLTAQVRKYYSWIPKEIIAKFVKECPQCQQKRTMSASTLGHMSTSQSYFMSLQDADVKLSDKKPITLSQARAAMMRIPGYTPKERPAPGRVHMIGNSSSLGDNRKTYSLNGEPLGEISSSYMNCSMFVTTAPPSGPSRMQQPFQANQQCSGVHLGYQTQPQQQYQVQDFQPSYHANDTDQFNIGHGHGQQPIRQFISQRSASFDESSLYPQHHIDSLRRVSEGMPSIYCNNGMGTTPIPHTRPINQFITTQHSTPDFNESQQASNLADPNQSPDPLGDVRRKCGEAGRMDPQRAFLESAVSGHFHSGDQQLLGISSENQFASIPAAHNLNNHTAAISSGLAQVHVDNTPIDPGLIQCDSQYNTEYTSHPAPANPMSRDGSGFNANSMLSIQPEKYAYVAQNMSRTSSYVSRHGQHEDVNPTLVPSMPMEEYAEQGFDMYTSAHGDEYREEDRLSISPSEQHYPLPPVDSLHAGYDLGKSAGLFEFDERFQQPYSSSLR